MYDYLIVGAGLYGSTFAWKAKQNGYKCLVIDKRPHLGGNIYCEEINGTLIHKYGPHVFHTNSKYIWNFVNQFVEFKPYILQTIANNNGKLYNLPFNMNTFYQLWGVTTPEKAKEIINSQIIESNCENLEEQALSLVGTDIYNILIKNYTEKQWGLSCKELPAYIIKRIPLRFTFDNNYFNDTYQGIANYNILIQNLLKDIPVEINTNFQNIPNWRNIAKKLVYTGPIDEYYNNMFGSLRWRSLKWEIQEGQQGVFIMNYTDKKPYTRICEYGNLLVKEYPSKEGDPYYPIDIENPYSLITDEDVIFGGRLAEYKYYNMDQIIEKAIYDCTKSIR